MPGGDTKDQTDHKERAGDVVQSLEYKGTPVLLKASPTYIGLVLIQLLFLGMGLTNLIGKVDGRLTNTCKFFLITLLAQFTGWIRCLRGISDTMWTPQR